jgi:nicotinamidase-related amidase
VRFCHGIASTPPRNQRPEAGDVGWHRGCSIDPFPMALDPPSQRGVARSPRGKGTALLLVDWINDFDFPEGDDLLEAALPAARRTAALRERATAASLPIIYVNDNFGCWRSDFERVVERCRESPGAEIADILAPRDDDYFVLKPKHSAFLHTPLELLLDHLGIGRIILTGLAGDICVLFTAHDAHMRDFLVTVPKDCVASNTREANETALAHLRDVVHADVLDSTMLVLPTGAMAPHRSGVWRGPVHDAAHCEKS